MRLEEFSDQFDTLLDSFAASAEFGEPAAREDLVLNEHEKSLFLTNAQEEVVMEIYNGKNVFHDSFESTEENRRYLSGLVTEAELKPTDGEYGVFDDTFDYTFDHSSVKIIGVDAKSKFFVLPKNLWFITYESVKVSDSKCEGTSILDVFPVRQDEYHKIKRNPFRGANDRRALRLDLSGNIVEIVSRNEVTDYYLRFLRKPRPIVLNDMPDGITIDGIGTASDCEMHEALHRIILERAVRMALQSKGYNIKNENK